MNKYRVGISLDCCYDIDAPNEAVAIEIAEQFFYEAIPYVEVEELEDEDAEERD